MREGTLSANGLSFHYLADGPEDGPLALLLHGFPEFSYSWRHQLPALAARGLHVVAPDLRGYHLSDKPTGVAAYDIDLLADDVVGWMDALGAPRAHVVGHDWGGAVAWQVAMRHPRRVDKLAVLDCPHPAVLAAESLWQRMATLRNRQEQLEPERRRTRRLRQFWEALRGRELHLGYSRPDRRPQSGLGFCRSGRQPASSESVPRPCTNSAPKESCGTVVSRMPSAFRKRRCEATSDADPDRATIGVFAA